MKNKIKNTVKKTLQTGAIVSSLILGGYHFSEKIGYIQHDVQEELKDNLGKKEILKDQETNDIIKLMSGLISQKEFDAMLKRHGHENDSIRIDSIITPDIALYNTIVEMQTKYGNPKISFSGNFKNFETGENQPKRARFDFITNTIKSHQLDSVMLQFNNIQKEEGFWLEHIEGLQGLAADTRQKYLINNWIAELAHAKQLTERGLIKMYVDGNIEYAGSGFDYDKLYEKEGTKEYQAHKEYEPELAQEFITIYEKYANKESPELQRKLARFNSGFFDAFSDEEQTHIHLKNLELKGDPEACYFLGKYYFDLYKDVFDVGYCKMEDDTIPKKIFGKEYTAKSFFDYMISYYKKAYDAGNVNAGCAMIEILANRRRGEYPDLSIKIGEDLFKNHINEMEREEIGNVAQKLGLVYFTQHNNEKADEYYKLSDEYGGGYTYTY